MRHLETRRGARALDRKGMPLRDLGRAMRAVRELTEHPLGRRAAVATLTAKLALQRAERIDSARAVSALAESLERELEDQARAAVLETLVALTGADPSAAAPRGAHVRGELLPANPSHFEP